jgi:hypothetical protein
LCSKDEVVVGDVVSSSGELRIASATVSNATGESSIAMADMARSIALVVAGADAQALAARQTNMP